LEGREDEGGVDGEAEGGVDEEDLIHSMRALNIEHFAQVS